MASLLVSVRSADEARAALDGGAKVIDVKEPDRGPLGGADARVWTEVRQAVPRGTALSVALGELRDCIRPDGQPFPDMVADPTLYRGFAFRKIGLAGAGENWAHDWERLRKRWGDGPAWVAVIYVDWITAKAPHPDRVLDVAMTCDECYGLLVDTWDKTRPNPVDHDCRRWLARAHAAGLLTAIAGNIDHAAIDRLAPLQPDIVAVRGSACRDGDRRAPVDPARVSRLAQAVAAV